MQSLRNTKSLTLTTEPGDEPNGGWTAHTRTPRYEKPHRSISDNQKRGHVNSFMQTKMLYKKLNISETGGCDDEIGQILFTRHFLKAQ